MALTFVKSKKDRNKLTFNGYIYRKDRTTIDGGISWRCDQKPCRGRVRSRTELVANVHVITEHTCALNMSRIEIATACNRIKDRSATTQETARQIIATSTLELSEEAKAKFPKYNTVQRLVERTRKQNHQPYPSPATLAEIQVPAALLVTKSNEPFLLHDSGADDPERFFIFCSPSNMETLEAHQTWCADGTFKVCPQLFYQLWTIHAVVHNTVLPMCYVLMTRKTENLYNRVLDALCHGRNFAPTLIISDFESAAINSFKTKFPSAQIHGCFFHLAQSVWRHVQNYGQAQRYVHQEEFRTSVKMVVALAFVRVNEVVDTFVALQEQFEHDDGLMGILDYFEDVYIGRLRRGNRQPRFSIELWNCHQLTADGLPRTNNNVEAWHRVFQGTIDLKHPTVYRLIGSMQVEQSLMETRRAQLNAGREQPTYSKQIYQQINENLQHLIEDYENRQLMNFLRGCAHNFDF